MNVSQVQICRTPSSGVRVLNKRNLRQNLTRIYTAIWNLPEGKKFNLNFRSKMRQYFSAFYIREIQWTQRWKSQNIPFLGMPATQVLFVALVFNRFQGLPLKEPPMLQTSLPTKLLQLGCEAFWLQEYGSIQEENVSKTYWENPHQFIKFQRKAIPECEIYSCTDVCKEIVHGHSQPPSVPCIFYLKSMVLETIQVRYLGVISWVAIFLSSKPCVILEKRGTS